MDTSPSKRRVLASVDVNSRTPGAISKLADAPKSNMASSPPSRSDTSTAKRSLNPESTYRQAQQQQDQLEQSAKRRRVSADHDEARPGTAGEGRDAIGHDHQDADGQQPGSPDEDSSMFDNSAIDTSQATTITEPDTHVSAPVPPARSPLRRPASMTREEARRKAEKLRLRLGLAGYKVRTGQTDVPLERLELKPLSGSRDQPSLPPLPRAEPASKDADVEGGREKPDGDEDESQRRTRLAAMARKALPQAPPPRQGEAQAGRRSLPGLPSGPQRAQ
ncbi:hypothetical protein GGR52DRAFT_194419 [Hypoxylon sp. FL1284]|nr:hypothetical protein GGR52DRAFT_194419 [Hypoxylon sp. FL1284]